MDYKLIEGKWDSWELPSKIIKDSREKQLQDGMMIDALLNEAEEALRKLKDSVFKQEFQYAFDCLRDCKPIVNKNQIKI